MSKDAVKKNPAPGSGQPNTPTEPRQDQISASSLEREHGQYRMLSDLQASIVAIRESLTFLREDVKRVEGKLDTHSIEIRDLMIEVRSSSKIVKFAGVAIPIIIAFLMLLWAVGSKLLDLIGPHK